MKQPDWGMGTSCCKSNMAANSSGLKKKKLVLLMMMIIQDEEAFSKIVSRKVCSKLWMKKIGQFDWPTGDTSFQG